MSINKSVFASKAESINFYKLCRTWGEQYRIYHNLPFLNVFNIKSLVDISNSKFTKISLAQIEIQRLKKTSIDFTICNTKDSPLICVEFDGLQEGFNVGKTYQSDIPYPPDPWRQQITELKLKVAYGSFFPYFVVGSSYFEDISKEIEFTIVDGIIGTVLANKAVQEKLTRDFNPEEAGWTREKFDALSCWEQNEIIQYWLIDLEVEKSLEYNPISRTRWQLQSDFNITSYNFRPLYSPNNENTRNFEKRIKINDKAVLQGASITLHTEEFGDIEAKILIADFDAFGFFGFNLAENIAFILAIEKLKKLKTSKT